MIKQLLKNEHLKQVHEPEYESDFDFALVVADISFVIFFVLLFVIGAFVV
jgi:hypothetical protein